jgi:hypothetical protein
LAKVRRRALQHLRLFLKRIPGREFYREAKEKLSGEVTTTKAPRCSFSSSIQRTQFSKESRPNLLLNLPMLLCTEESEISDTEEVGLNRASMKRVLIDGGGWFFILTVFSVNFNLCALETVVSPLMEENYDDIGPRLRFNVNRYVVWLTWNGGQDLPKSPANKPAEVNAFMKQTGEKPFIYQPRDDVYLFYDVFVEGAARKWKRF